MRSEIASVVTHNSGYGNAVVDGREKNQWSKFIIDQHCQGFSEQNIKQLINGYEFDLVYPTVVEQAVETIRNLTNALFAVGQFEEKFQDTDADYIEKHLGWSHQSPTHVTLAIR